MKKLGLFFSGIGNSIRKSYGIILSMFCIVLIGIIGFGFCYRNVVFFIRQPERVDVYKSEEVYSYSMTGDINVNHDDILKMNEEKICGIIGYSEINISNNKVGIHLVVEDIYNDKLITKEQFDKGEKVVVLDNSLGYEYDKIMLFGQEYTVISSQSHNTYLPFNSVDKYYGSISIYSISQLNRGEMTNLEKVIGIKMNRDSNYMPNGNLLDPLNIVFLVLGILIFIAFAFNLYKLMSIYDIKNYKRYELYRKMGKTYSNISAISILEKALYIFIFSLVGILIDALLIRPILTIAGVMYMYDIIDIIVILSGVLLAFFACVLIIVIKNMISKRGLKYEKQ